MDLPESRVVMRCAVCGGDIVERTSQPAEYKIVFTLTHESPDPACRQLLDSIATARQRLVEKFTTSASGMAGV